MLSRKFNPAASIEAFRDRVTQQAFKSELDLSLVMLPSVGTKNNAATSFQLIGAGGDR